MKLILILRSSLVTFLFMPLWTFFWSAVSIMAQGMFKSPKTANMIFLIWARVICFLYGTKVVTRGRENFPEGGAMLLFNHTSFFDIFAMYAAFPIFRFGAKMELFSIPIFGPAMRAVGTLPIARGNREAAIRVLQAAVQRARNGEKFALSPEGGRNTEEKLLPFKAGPFLFAIEAQVPLVPVVIRGAQSIYPKNSILPALKSWSSTITIDVLPPIPTTGISIDDRHIVQEKAREAMLAKMSEPI